HHSIKEFTNEAGRYEFDRQREIRKQGRKSSYEIPFVRPNGTIVHCLVSASPIFDSSGAKTGSFALVTDITKLRMTLEELTELKENLEKKVEERTAKLVEANRDLESFSYSVSHDLRAPLRSIDGFSQALLEDFLDKLPPDGQDYLKRIRAATQKMGDLIDDILALSRVTRHVMRGENVDLSKLANEIMKELCENNPARKVEYSIAENMVVTGDARLLEIALKNLLGNAWKFTSKKDLPKIVFDYSDETGKRIYRIEDNGAGFDMKYIDKLFGVFQRLHDVNDFPGTGIGLTIVRKIIQRHGGQIWAEGAVGRGATFYFTIDFHEEQPQEEETV
ncbi:MAG: ATP-binding protein, partial [Candidatus Nanoarchaeia archaeon]